ISVMLVLPSNHEPVRPLGFEDRPAVPDFTLGILHLPRRACGPIRFLMHIEPVGLHEFLVGECVPQLVGGGAYIGDIEEFRFAHFLSSLKYSSMAGGGPGGSALNIFPVSRTDLRPLRINGHPQRPPSNRRSSSGAGCSSVIVNRTTFSPARSMR